MIHKALRLIRLYHDLSSGELAKKLEISPSYLSEIESAKHKPSLAIIEKYANIFDIKPSAILFFSENISDTTLSGALQNSIRVNIIAFLEAIKNSEE